MDTIADRIVYKLAFSNLLCRTLSVSLTFFNPLSGAHSFSHLLHGLLHPIGLLLWVIIALVPLHNQTQVAVHCHSSPSGALV